MVYKVPQKSVPMNGQVRFLAHLTTANVRIWGRPRPALSLMAAFPPVAAALQLSALQPAWCQFATLRLIGKLPETGRCWSAAADPMRNKPSQKMFDAKKSK